MNQKLHNDEFYTFHFSSDIVRVIKWRRFERMGCVPLMWEMKNAYTFARKPDGKRPLEGRRSK
jgi:hypothetical protein